MKKFIVYAALLINTTFLNASDELQVQVKNVQAEALHIMIGILPPVSLELQEIATTLQKDLQMSQQCIVSIQNFQELAQTEQIKQLAQQNIYMAIFLQTSEQDDAVEWRLYDTQQALMLQGERHYKQKGMPAWMNGHELANKLWPLMMGQQGCFISKIAYCKHVENKKRSYRHLYIADVHGDHSYALVQRPSIVIAPRWNSSLGSPLLFYSECALSNVRLCMVNMHGISKIICNCNGINMLPAFSADDQQIVFCLTKEGSSQLYHYAYDKTARKKVCKRITFNNGNNISPCFINDHTLIFASDYASKHPHLYTLNLLTKEIAPFITQGYCACPAYCAVNNKLAYGKMMQGAMQIFVYDFATKTHTQITKGPENKEEPAWSPCGNYIAFAAEKNNKSKICIVNLMNKKVYSITPEHEDCTYPAWSPEYKVMIP